jgi:thymidine kinase
MNAGFLEIVLGPMFSGKTTHLVELYKTYMDSGMNVLVINYSADTRYDDKMLSTHDKVMIPCVFADNLSGISRYENYDVVLINEGQFFPDLFDFVNQLLKESKKIYVCGLDGDFERKKFGQILDLISLCDKVNKLSSLCSQCKDGTPGIFSMRLTNETKQTVVGSENYIPVCRKCYDNPK